MARKTSRKRSRPYPRRSLKECLDFIRMVDEAGRDNVAEDVLVARLGLSTANSHRFTGLVSSSKQFGLLTVDNGQYTVRDLGKRYLNPLNDEERRQATVEAFNSPKLYQELIEKFGGGSLPDKQKLANTLLRYHGIESKVSSKATEIFIDSAEFAGLLGSDGRLLSALDSGRPETPADLSQSAPEPPLPQADVQIVKLALSTGMAQLNVPANITNKDAERLKILIDLLVAE
jgi:hypothetical protein